MAKGSNSLFTYELRPWFPTQNLKDSPEKRKSSRTALFLNTDKTKKVDKFFSRLTKIKRMDKTTDVDTDAINKDVHDLTGAVPRIVGKC